MRVTVDGSEYEVVRVGVTGATEAEVSLEARDRIAAKIGEIMREAIAGATPDLNAARGEPHGMQAWIAARRAFAEPARARLREIEAREHPRCTACALDPTREPRGWSACYDCRQASE